VNDSLGGPHTMTLTFTKDFAGGAGQWDWAVTESDAAIASVAGNTGTVTFSTSGAVSAGSTGALSVVFGAASGVASPQAVTLDFGTVTNTAPLNGFSGASSVSMTSQDGYTAGSLTSFAIGSDGTVTGHYSNGRNASIAQLELVSFANPGGLERQGQNLFKESVNSGPPQRGVPSTGGRGSLLPGSLEASNVDLAREFTELITAQRGFEASAKIIRIGDEILQTAVNIKQ
jgi:flagellar hook protein FlgE